MAFRLSERNKFTIPWAYGYAKDWGVRARGEGYLVDMNPAVGAVAWWSSDHVAWVEAISPDGSIVTIEEYNYDYRGHYNERQIKKSAVSGYIHFLDIEQPPPGDPSASVPVRGDFTGDGHDDLLAVGRRSDPAPNLMVFRSMGSWLGGSELWAAPANLTFDGSIAIPADLDGDHKDDILAVQRQGDGGSAPLLYWHRSTGSNFESGRHVGTPSLPYDDTRWTSGDFNGDGKDDLLAISKRSDPGANLIVLRSTGSGLGATELWSSPAQLSFDSAVFLVADVNGDGKDDLLGIQKQANGAAPIVYWIKSKGSRFAAPLVVGIPPLIADNTRWLTGDFTGDGKDDLLAMSRRADSAPNLLVLASTRKGLGSAELWSAPAELVWGSFTAVPADLDGDGRTDVLAPQLDTSDPNATDLWWVQAQTASFASPALVGVPGLPYAATRWQR